jgi:hypothetical protein
MLTKEKRLRAIRQILNFCFLIIAAQSCNNHKEGKPDTKIADQKKYEADTLSATIKKVEISDTNASITDTLLIGDIHITVNEANNFFNGFKKNPGKFYYSEIERRDFFLLHDQSSKKYYLFGAENGGCLSCFSYVEFINNIAFKKALLPEEIQDTIQFKPHNIAELEYKILEYPFLNLNSSLSLIEKKLIQAGFKLLTDKGKSKTYKKTTDYSIVSIFITENKVNRISVQLNIDA